MSSVSCADTTTTATKRLLHRKRSEERNTCAPIVFVVGVEDEEEREREGREGAMKGFQQSPVPTARASSSLWLEREKERER
jgi:hypothetical protein